MGEVYRARDPKLNRDVAIKVLLPAVANDPDRLARFSREAQVLASLNHPNIAALYGLEEGPAEAGRHIGTNVASGFSRITALVMELVEGEDLSHRIARGAIPIDEALPIARQIAEALEAAHELGIIHRDLKPANIKVRLDGTVKVLDFGLAKAVGQGSGIGDQGSGGAANSPTLSIHATEAGIILGTAAYMSPEQAKGKTVDRRADIWAFGAVLFEMVTGKRAFAGDDISDTLVSVLRDDPDWTALPGDTPPGVEQALRVCLRKDPRQRVRDISAVRLSMEGAFDTRQMRAATTPPAEESRSAMRSWVMAPAMLLIGAAVATVVTWMLMRATPQTGHPVRFTITPTEGVLGILGVDRDLAISPDGTRLAYVIGDGPTAALYVRALDQLEPTQLQGIAGARAPFFSPDNQWIGFFTGSVNGGFELKKVLMTGGPPIVLCRMAGSVVGASWGEDDTIVFATLDRATGLMRVPASGGDPAVLSRPDPAKSEVDHVLPFVLPGGNAVVFTSVNVGSAIDLYDIAALDLTTGQHQILIRGASHAEYVAPASGAGPGYLVYAAAGTLRAVRFDPARLAVLSGPVPLVERVLGKSNGTAEFHTSRTGTLVYVEGATGQQGFGDRTLAWVDRQGKEKAIAAPPRSYVYPRVSPDGARIALDIRDQEQDIWTWDVARGVLTRLTLDPAADTYPVWTPDGRRIIFTSARTVPNGLFIQPADGTGSPERLVSGTDPFAGYSMTPDGKTLVAREGLFSARRDLTLIRMAPTPHSEPLLHASFYEENAEFSPDGRWLAYQTNESGQSEIYVRPFPQIESGRWQVSISGGQQAMWSRNGRELFYVDAKTQVLMSAAVQATATFSSAAPVRVIDMRPYFVSPLGRAFDVSLDGQSFLVIKNARSTAPDGVTSLAPEITVVLNWLDELAARVPVTK
ncbi:MAG: protein kinase [Acidobacteriota bacterium]|nr:protein kinase [Acidobacteriota bacterium]